MNTLFWIFCGVMIVIALLFVLLPLWRKPIVITQREPDNQTNIDLAKQRLAELKQQRADGVLDESHYQAQYDELQRVLLDDWVESAPEQAIRSDGGRWLTWFVLWLIPLGSLAMYAALGDPDAPQKQQVQQANEQAFDQLLQKAETLKQQLQQQPDNLQLALQLGALYQQAGDYPHAVLLYGSLSQRHPENEPLRAGLVDSLVDMAHALSMQADGQISADALGLVEKALQIAPNHQKGLYLAGWAKYQADDFKQAIVFWKQVLEQLPADNPGNEQIQQMIADATAKQTQTVSTPGLTIAVKVSLDKALASKLDPQSTLFVYAQAPSGPKMPICIARLKASQLPASVTLDDRDALNPANRMANYQQLKLLARISKTGNPMSQSGDLLGSVEIALPLTQSPVSISINQTVP